ncbi:hypothetical protein CIK05_11015 [Bdellovibrio sp. qaytius]|nr:hypothetical protein CIK05_11015 [Bdellovibrio sp. qaytius]
MKNNNMDWLQEYEEFLNADKTPIPESVNRRILANLYKLVNPSPIIIFFKILGIHSVISFLSLSICHQFGLNPFNTERSLDSWMMSAGGHNACMVGCGVLFVGASLFLSGYFLSIEEVTALKRTKVLQTISLAVISLSLLIAAGAQVALTIGLLWFIGALIGGMIAVETSLILKRV